MSTTTNWPMQGDAWAQLLQQAEAQQPPRTIFQQQYAPQQQPQYTAQQPQYTPQQPQYAPQQPQYTPQQLQYAPQHQPQYGHQQPQYVPQHQPQYTPQHQPQYAPQHQPQYGHQQPQYVPQHQPQYTPQRLTQQPKLDARTSQFQQYITSPGQFKPVKLYVLFNDKTSQQCVEVVRANGDLDRQVEVVDAGRPENRPTWLTGVPSLLDESNSFFIGAQCVAWIKYYGTKTLRSINESTGTSQIMAGAPAAMDGSAVLSGAALGSASFIPQESGADLTSVQQYAPPQQQQQQGPVQLPFQPVRVGKDNGNAEKMNQLIGQIQNDRGALLNRVQPPHHMQQQQMGWGQ